jgi:hypothetical protein
MLFTRSTAITILMLTAVILEQLRRKLEPPGLSKNMTVMQYPTGMADKFNPLTPNDL